MQTDVHSFLATTCYLLLGVILMLTGLISVSVFSPCSNARKAGAQK